MKKLPAKILAILLAVCLIFSIAACSTDVDGANVIYSVTVTGADSVVLRTVSVKLTDEDDAEVAEKRLSDGKATFSLPAGTYKVALSGEIGAYDWTAVTLTAAVRSGTVTLTPKSDAPVTPDEIEYTVQLKYPDGDPVANADVQLCSTSCYSAKTNEQGIATFSLAPATYEFHLISEVPEGYTFDNTKYKVTATSTSIVAMLEALESFVVTVKYAATRNESGEAVDETPVDAGINVSLYTVFDATPKKVATAATDSSGNATIKAKKGTYKVVIENCPQNFSYSETTLDSDDEITTATIILTEAGADRHHRIAISAEADTEVVISPKASDFWYELEGDTGTYTVETEGELDTFIKFYMVAGGGFFSKINGENDKQDKDGTDKNAIVYFDVENVQTIYVFNIGVVPESLPDPVTGTFTIKVTRTGDYTPPAEPPTVVVQPQNTLEDAPEIPEDTAFAFLDPGDADIVLGTDGYYHVNTEDGPLVYAAIGDCAEANHPRVIDETIIYMMNDFSGSVIIRKTVNNEEKDYNYGDYYIDGSDAPQPGFISQYAAKCNDDGMYPLTEELKEFLQDLASKGYYMYTLEDGWSLFNQPTGYTANEQIFLFACGTYKPLYETCTGAGDDNDPFALYMCGSYKFEVEDGGVYTAQVSARGMEFTVTLVSGDATLTGATNDALTVNYGDVFTFSTTGEATVIIKVEPYEEPEEEEGEEESSGEEEESGNAGETE